MIQGKDCNADDWIPGDWGHLLNPAFKDKDKIKPEWNKSHRGQNVIFVGENRFWGWAGEPLILTLEEWQEHINKNFDPKGGGQGIDECWRFYPKIGLE